MEKAKGALPPRKWLVLKVINRKARYNFDILEKFEAGIVLTGAEVKSVKEGRIKLDEAFVKIVNGELWLLNSHISPYRFAGWRNYQPTRTRKLLLHKKEILSLEKKIEGQNLTIVPLACYNKRRKIKIEIAIARGKKKWEKREKIKKRDLDREVERTLREKI